MAKEKKRTIDENEKSETLFYYEILGITFIILTVIILGKLGTVGKILTSFFKIIFGDLYWFFLLFLLLYGILSLLRHKSFDFKSQRFIGYVFFSLGLLIISHFPIHNYVIQKEGSYLTNVWNIYKVYLDTSLDTLLGGGLLGAILFYAIHFLFGKFGVIVISVLAMILGISLMINRSLFEISKFIFLKLKGVKKGLNNFNNFFKYDIGKTKIIKKECNLFSKTYQLPLSVFESFNNTINMNSQNKLAIEIKSTINSILNSMHIEFREVNYYISYRLSTFNYLIYSPFNSQLILKKLTNVIEDDVAIGFDDNALVVQVVNRFSSLLTIKELLMKQESLSNNFIIPLGIKQNGQLLEQDFLKFHHLLLVGSISSGIRNFISYFIFANFVKNKTNEFEIEIFDNLEEFFFLSDFYIDPKEYDINMYLDKLTKEIEEKCNILSSNHVLSISEYNKKQAFDGNIQNQIKRKFIIINHFEETKENYVFFENKLMYITQLGEKCGINVIYIVREYHYLSNIILSLFTNRIIFKTDDNRLSKDIMNNDNSNYLLKDGDCYYVYKNKNKRMQTALVTGKEINNIKKEIKIK